MLGSSSGGSGVAGVGIVGSAVVVDSSVVVASTEISSVPLAVVAAAGGLTATGQVFPSSSSAKNGSAPFFSIVDCIGRRNSSCRGKNGDFLGNKPELKLLLSLPPAMGTGRR